VKFIYADSLDFVDPSFNFLEDRHASNRSPYWDDMFAHEILGVPPYKGVLISRGIVGDERIAGKYTQSQAMRFRRVGAREFLRLNKPQFLELDIFGDCGAFTYHKEYEPPYSSEGMAEFYEDGGFTHGCSVDHIIFDFREGLSGLEGGSEEERRRLDITLENAKTFIKASKNLSNRFTPLGVIQGWSPASMAEAARQLVAMGYEYLAVGGTVSLSARQLKAALQAIRESIPVSTKLHVLGFGKVDDISSFSSFRITSFDTTSPLLRAFKDSVKNYYLKGNNNRMEYYTAIRIPQSRENVKLVNLVKRGQIKQEELIALERNALGRLRAFDKEEASLDETLEAILAYAVPATLGARIEGLPGSQGLSNLRERYHRTLTEQPWKRCDCAICRDASVEVMIFRGSNRNKRRGIHNIKVFNSLVDSISRGDLPNESTDLFSGTSAAES